MQLLSEPHLHSDTRRWPASRVVLVCAALGVASLAIPATNGYDPFSWLVWGREIPRLALDTTGGPSWKPLPVLFTTLLAPLGGVAPTLWLFVTRVLGFLAVAFTYRLAARFAGPIAGLVAAAVLLVGPDPDPRFVRLLLEGHTDVASATFALWSLERHLDRRYSHAVLLATAVALLRPEAWPFLGVYAVWLGWSQPTTRWLLGGCLAAVPLLWFVPDWWGSGSPWRGADSAQVNFAATTNRIELAFRRAGELMVLPAWGAAAVGVISAVRRREAALVVSALAAGAWIAIVVAMTVLLHYASLSRFFLPAVVIACILAGIGAVRAVRAVAQPAARLALLVAMVAASAVFAAPRVAGLPDVLGGVERWAEEEDDLVDVVDRAGGREVLVGCGELSVDWGGGVRPSLAWHLDVPLSDIGAGPVETRGIVIARVGTEGDLVEAGDPPSGELVTLARNSSWVVFSVNCASAVPEALSP